MFCICPFFVCSFIVEVAFFSAKMLRDRIRCVLLLLLEFGLAAASDDSHDSSNDEKSDAD